MYPSRFADNLIAVCFALLTGLLIVKTTNILHTAAKLPPAPRRLLKNALKAHAFLGRGSTLGYGCWMQCGLYIRVSSTK